MCCVRLVGLHPRSQLRRGRFAAATAAVLLAIGLAPRSQTRTQTPTSPTAAGDSAAACRLYQCCGDLGDGECAACVQGALAQLDQVCPARQQRRCSWRGATVRYGSTNFVGRPDTASMVYHASAAPAPAPTRLPPGAGTPCSARCDGRSRQKVQDRQLRRRAGRLAGAWARPRRRRLHSVPGAGRRAAQEGRLTAVALAADVHLAQCYVGYWASGYYFRPHRYY
ncbi:hypothetical protein ZWY2020_028727 [Hordeum vulgare]|nr:hypothetical protein ZWY2020_028727 [Hordeum vulgare]